jgi:mgtE-like transporter
MDNEKNANNNERNNKKDKADEKIDRQEDLENYASIRKILKEIIPILTITSIGSLFAGFVLSGMQEQLELLPGLMVLVPAVMDTRGNIYGALGSRLSSGMHLGVIRPRFERNKNLTNAIGVSLINTVAVSIAMSVLAYILLWVLSYDTIPLWALTSISLLAGTMSGFILLSIVVFAGFFGYQRGLDPDNVLSPIVTITGDIFSILTLLFASQIVLSILN